MISHGLDPNAPFVSHEAFGGYSNPPMPTWLGDEYAKAVVKTMSEARDRALALAKEHEAAIRALAAIVYRERRLTDHAVTRGSGRSASTRPRSARSPAGP